MERLHKYIVHPDYPKPLENSDDIHRIFRLHSSGLKQRYTTN
jgi:hypothetical protein